MVGYFEIFLGDAKIIRLICFPESYLGIYNVQ
jgi:hypothetical protein